jgi:hypothetical protein
VASTDQNPDTPSLAMGFPRALGDDVAAVQPVIRGTIDLRGRVEATVSGEQVAFAHRLYNPEPSGERVAALTSTQRLIAHCVYSRHHDGHVRQRHCEQIVRSTAAWVPPYVVRLVGEYVVEIIEMIRDKLGGLETGDEALSTTMEHSSPRPASSSNSPAAERSATGTTNTGTTTTGAMTTRLTRRRRPSRKYARGLPGARRPGFA